MQYGQGMEFVLEFERPIVELQKRIDGLKEIERTQGTNLSKSIEQLRRQADSLLEQIFTTLTPWQRTLLSRHPGRPYTLGLRRPPVHRLDRAPRRSGRIR
jgi:acetyl-CoA carboxylase carboxyl transferase subunit alpha